RRRSPPHSASASRSPSPSASTPRPSPASATWPTSSDLPPEVGVMVGAMGTTSTPRSVGALVAAEVARRGPGPVSAVMALALCHAEPGFFSRGGGAGRRGDFLTSPEVGPLFGAVIARALDGWWDELGRPDPFVVVEAGAGVGTLAREVLHATPACVRA